MLHIQKSKFRSIQIYEFGSHLYVQQNSILEAKPLHFSKVVYAPAARLLESELRLLVCMAGKAAD